MCNIKAYAGQAQYEVSKDFIENKNQLERYHLLKNSRYNTEESKYVFNDFFSEYYYNTQHVNFDALEKAIDLKLEKNQETLQSNITIKIDYLLKKSDYMIEMFNIFLDNLKYQNFHWQDPKEEEDKYFIEDVSMWRGKHVSSFLKKNITREEIKNNLTEQSLTIKDKKYQAGTKLTKIMSTISDHYSDTHLKNRVVGNFVYQTDKEKDIFLTANPTAFVMAGYYGQSCTSPSGENKEAGIAAIGYPNALVAHDTEFTWRAFVFIDEVNKKFSVYKGYPRENYYAQILIKKYFESKGYRFAKYEHDDSFSTPHYMDKETIFTAETPKEKITGPNYDAHFNWHMFGLNLLSIPYNTDKSIINVYYCEHCDTKSFYDEIIDGRCDSCREQLEYCEECGEYHDSDNRYSETLEQYICYNCYEKTILENEDDIKSFYLEISKELLKDIPNIAANEIISSESPLAAKDLEERLLRIVDDESPLIYTSDIFDLGQLIYETYWFYDNTIDTWHIESFFMRIIRLGLNQYKAVREIVSYYQYKLPELIQNAKHVLDKKSVFDR